MPNKKKETTGLLVAVAPVTMEEKEKKYGGGLLKSDRKQYAKGEGVGYTEEELQERRSREHHRALERKRDARRIEEESERGSGQRFLDRQIERKNRPFKFLDPQSWLKPTAEDIADIMEAQKILDDRSRMTESQKNKERIRDKIYNRRELFPEERDFRFL